MKKTLQELDRSASEKMKLILHRDFRSVYDLSYALVDLQSVLGTFYYATSTKSKAKRIPSTSRSFSNRYKDALILESFSKGSFIATVLGTFIAGILLLFIERLFFERRRNAAVEVSPSEKKLIQVEFINKSDYARAKQLVDSVPLNNHHTANSIKNLFHDLQESDLEQYGEFITTDEGAKLISDDVERFYHSIGGSES